MRVSCGLEYTVMKSGVAILNGIGNCLDEHIVVPSEVCGYPVVGVSEKAFARSLQIKSVTLPSSVNFIEAQAFAWCRELIFIKVSGATMIGDRAFIGCDKLKLVNLEATEVIGEKAFAYCPALYSVTLPDSLQRICPSAFEGCRGIKCITIPNSVRIIENGTFYACSSLCKVSLPTSLEYVDEYAFAYCSSLVDMEIPYKTVINNDAFFECSSIARNGKVS